MSSHSSAAEALTGRLMAELAASEGHLPLKPDGALTGVTEALRVVIEKHLRKGPMTADHLASCILRDPRRIGLVLRDMTEDGILCRWRPPGGAYVYALAQNPITQNQEADH